jgi:ATP-dependent DNA helicase RecG
LRLSGIVEDKAFALFIRQIQQERKDDEKLSVQEIILLNRIRKGVSKNDLDTNILKKLEKDGLVERVGKTNSQKFILSKAYFIFIDKRAEYSAEKSLEQNQFIFLILQHLQEFGKAKMGDFEILLQKFITRDQVRYLIGQMVVDGMLDKEGQGKGTTYKQGKKIEDGTKLASRAFQLGVEEMKKRGELPNE